MSEGTHLMGPSESGEAVGATADGVDVDKYGELWGLVSREKTNNLTFLM